jgi:CheY-like chemotaxis protein
VSSAPQPDREVDVESAKRSDLLSRASHELRTPLNAILGFAQLLEMDELSEEQERRVQQILKAGRRLVALIDDVLEVSRFEAGRLPISLEPVDPGAALRSTLDLIAPLARERAVRLSDAAVFSSEARVLADQQRLRYVLLKLMTAAVSRAGDGGSVHFACKNGDRADTLRLELTALPATGEEPPGPIDMELGLTLASRLAEAMQGTLGVLRAGDGTSILWVELSRAEDAASGTRPGLRDPDETTEATVLYIEDNVVNVELVSELLAARGRVATLNAMDGELGLELARQHQPKLIFLDLDLPDMDGETVLRRLKADAATADIPVVMLSSAAAAGHEERMLAAGALGYLTKPLDLDAFLDLVERALG